MNLLSWLCIAGDIESVTQLGDVVYVICPRSSTILRFRIASRQRLADIDVIGMMSPHDIVACENRSRLYIADWECVWRVSVQGADIRRWLPNAPTSSIKPWTLSVTSTRLLVTSCDVKQLIQFDAFGNELNRVQLPCNMVPRHAVESPAGTFIVGLTDTQADRDQVVEVNTRGVVLRQFSGLLRWPDHIGVDLRGNVFVADTYNRHILLLDRRLALRRVIIDERRLNYRPLRGLCYREQTGHLLVPLDNSIAVFSVLCH